MKNGIKYAKEIQNMLNKDYYECSLWSVRNGKKASEDCRHIPESFDPVSGGMNFAKNALLNHWNGLIRSIKNLF